MIDTIKIMIPIKKIKIYDYEIFQPSAKGFFEMPFYKKSIKAIRNCSKKELENGNYFPKLTILKMKYGESLKPMLIVEFSIPKLLFNNNFEEVNNNSFENIIEILQEKLFQRRIEIERETLKTAEILSVHYSKNIELQNVSTKFIINTISKVEIPKNIDISQTAYKNDGSALHFHTNSYELTFYDKIADLKQSLISEKRAIEKDNRIQLELLNNEYLWKKQVLRMEVRLNKRKKIKNVFENCNIQVENLTFATLYDEKISRKILMYFWEKYIQKSIFTICLLEDDNFVLQEKMTQAGIKTNKIFLLIGMISAIKQTGTKVTKDVLKTHNFNRYKKELELINFDDNYLLKQFKYIYTVLEKMTPLSLKIALNPGM